MKFTGDLLFASFVILLIQTSSTPLDDYVNKKDDSYKYEIKEINVIDGLFTQYVINMTSQTWLNEKLVSQSEWYHYLTIIVPEKRDTDDFAGIYVGAGHNGDSLPGIKDQEVEFCSLLALSTNAITANLKQIPNQPIYFSEDPDKKRRTEDALIAYTWKHFIQNTSEPEYLARLPMTKAVVRAMDTITEVIRKMYGLNIQRFGVAGASKRGWTTWTSALVDTRIVAIVPIVLDVLNALPVLHHMYRAYDGWTFAFKDYFNANVTENLDTPETAELFQIVDPYAYFDRYKRSNLSILVINTCGDEFLMPDDNYYFWDKLPGPKYIKMLPNAEHSLTGHVLGAIEDISAFLVSVFTHHKLPEVSWKFENDQTLARVIFNTNVKPIDVVLWQANTLPNNPKRDFRLIAGPDPNNPTPQLILWKKKEANHQGYLTYRGEIDVPTVGWSGCFLEATYELHMNGKLHILQLSTQVNIVPNTFPYPDCHGVGCKGKLV